MAYLFVYRFLLLRIFQVRLPYNDMRCNDTGLCECVKSVLHPSYGGASAPTANPGYMPVKTRWKSQN